MKNLRDESLLRDRKKAPYNIRDPLIGRSTAAKLAKQFKLFT